jgi:hypothetical protein
MLLVPMLLLLLVLMPVLLLGPMLLVLLLVQMLDLWQPLADAHGEEISARLIAVVKYFCIVNYKFIGIYN